MRIIRDLIHFEHSPRQLVAVSFHDVGVEVLLEGHRSAAVGRPDAKGRGYGGHARLILLIDEGGGGPRLATGPATIIVRPREPDKAGRELVSPARAGQTYGFFLAAAAGKTG
jgi:hypothetical protein